MRKFKGELILLTTAIIWGTSFVALKLGMNYVKPFTFGASRFLLGSLSLIPIILIFDRMKGSNKNNFEPHIGVYRKKDLVISGVLCGVSIFCAASLQQFGLVFTTAGKAGFITTLYVVLVPIYGTFMRKKVDLFTWLSVAISVLGLYLLTIQEGFTIQKGDAIVLIGTIFWALQIVVVGVYANRVEGLKLSFVQFAIAGILSAIAAIIYEAPSISSIIASAGPIIYTAIMVVGVAYTLQIIGQKHANPTVAAIILSLESVFAVISGAFFLGESMNIRELIGCALMFLAVILTQVNPGNVLKMSKD